MPNIEFITDRNIYEKVILERIPFAKEFLWIGTSDMKDLYVSKNKKMVPFLEILSDLIKKGVSIRIIHAKEPGENYKKDFDKYHVLIKNIEMFLCPRIHFKSVIIDGRFAYSGSANLTGSGMGSKSKDKRNFESGFITDDPVLVGSIMSQFDQLWMGKHCKTCKRKEYCFEHKKFL
ncbi:MAG: phospholipase D family protein [Candidatus Delongbacteria bacterium]|nr:phospholipase D family protein [Candidatus Delongbacteria bacterium]